MSVLRVPGIMANGRDRLTPEVARELHRKAILLLAIFLVVHFLMLTARVAAVEIQHQGEIAKVRLIITPLTGLLCYAILLILQRWRGSGFARQAAIGAILSIACAFIHGWVWTSFLHDLNPHEYPDKPGNIIYQALYFYLFYFSWTTAYLALCYSITVREQERQAAALIGEAQEAKVRALRYQINPHFLFNTLNSIAQLIGEDQRQAEEMVLNLSEFFRTSLEINPTDDIRLADEFALQELYLKIERVRFPERLAFEVALSEDIAGALVPSLILQPLIENAVKHGVARSEGNTCIRVQARREGDRLYLHISDDARAAGAAQPAKNGTGIGLENVRSRLAARYGDAFSLETHSGETGGFTVELSLPLTF